MKHMRKLAKLFVAMATVACAAALAVPAVAMADSHSNCPDGCDHEAAIGAVHYDSLAEAVKAAETDSTVKLLKNAVSGDFIDVGNNCATNVTFDLNGKILTLNPAGGSRGTETSGFRVLKGNSATVKNGTVLVPFDISNSSAKNRVKVAFANYGTLALEGLVVTHTGNLDGDSGSKVAYTINNGGKLTVKSCQITNEVKGATAANYVLTYGDYTGGGSSVLNESSITIDAASKLVGDICREAVAENSASAMTFAGSLDGSIVSDAGTSLAALTITGGTYTVKPDEAFLADGLVFYGSGPWTVGPYVPPAPVTPPTITVPVEGDNAVHVEATVDGTKAEVEEITPDQIENVTSGNVASNVTVDFSGLDNDITEVSIPASSVEAITEAANDESAAVSGLEVKLPEATVQFDADALNAVNDAIAEETEGEGAPAASDVKVTLVVETVAVEDLAPAQQEALKDAPNVVVVQATVYVNDKPVSNFNGGYAKVTVPYTLPEGADAEHVTVWYIGSDGKMEAMQTSYKNGVVTFYAPHFSDYVVTSDEANYAHVCPSIRFSDFVEGAWYHQPMDWAVENGVLRGDDGKTTIRPTGDITRAEFLTMLYRIEGSPAVKEPCTFSDVDADDWFAGVMAWAQAEGVIKGDDGKTTVRPNDTITREDIVVILHRYAQLKGIDVSVAVDLSIFADASEASPYAGPALEWAVAAGVIQGYEGYLTPGDEAERAQAAAMIERLDAKHGLI